MQIKKLLKSILKPQSLQAEKNQAAIREYMLKNNYCSTQNIDSNDIVIVGFPKSGNTWMQNLIAGVLYGIDTTLLPDKLTQLLVPNLHGMSYYKKILDFTCFKSHLLPQPNYKKVVYIVRDGRDALISYYHMNQADKKDFTLEQMVKNGEGLFPSKWHEHVKAWQNNPYNAEIMWIRYEDLHLQPLVEMKRFCKFAGIERSDELLEQSINGNSFQKMQKKEQNFGWDNQKWDTEGKFIRKGKVGSFLDEMPPNLISFFEKEANQQLSELGYSITQK
jgi:hypothetical protein